MRITGQCMQDQHGVGALRIQGAPRFVCQMCLWQCVSVFKTQRPNIAQVPPARACRFGSHVSLLCLSCTRPLAAHRVSSCETSLQISDDVVDVFNADGQANRAALDS